MNKYLIYLTFITSSVLSTGCLNSSTQALNQEHTYLYFDDFENAGQNEIPDYWVQPGSENKWRVKAHKKNKVVESENFTSEPAQIYLHLFERNPLFKGQFNLLENNKGTFTILSRFNAEKSWLRVEVYPDENKVKLLEQEDAGKQAKLLAETACELEKGWNNFSLQLDSLNCLFYLNGTKVIDANNLTHCTFGRVGFETWNCRVQLDEIQYAGKQGRPNNGVVEYEFRQKDKSGKAYIQHLTIETFSGDTLIALGATADPRVISQGQNFPVFFLKSNDLGLSWQKCTGENQFILAGGDTIKHSCPQLLKLQSGRFVSCGLSKDGVWQFVVSDDNCKSWRKAGKLNNKDRNGMMPDKLTQSSDGKIYAHINRKLYASNNEGETWEHLINIPLYEAESRFKSVQEMQMVELPDNTLKTYARDGREGAHTLVEGISIPGEFWNDLKEVKNNTPFVAPKCAFNVEQDRFNPGHYYMFWTYNNRNNEPSVNNLPRTRLGLAVSYDGTKTWQYVMDVDDWGYPSTGFEEKDNRYANHALHVGEKYIYLSVKRRNPIGKKKHADTQAFYVRIDKSKIETYPEFPGTRY